jgi:hypothetical protein
MAPNPAYSPASSKKSIAFSDRKFLILALLLLTSLILHPFVEHGWAAYLAFRLIGSAGIIYSVYAIKLRRAVLICGILLAIPAILQHLFEFRVNAGMLSVMNIIFSFLFDSFVVVVIFRRIVMEEEPSSETIFGALCIYLLAAFSFASIYGMIATLQPGAFYLDPVMNTHTIPDRFDMVYYSFATMTSLGATGIAPVSNQARSISIIQTTLGVLYLAVLIARLVSAYRRSPMHELEPSPAEAVKLKEQ